MYALTVLSFDSDLSKDDKKTLLLLEMHRTLIQELAKQVDPMGANVGESLAVALYFENLKRFPAVHKTILGGKNFPAVMARELAPEVSPFQQKIFDGLKRKFAANKNNNENFVVVEGRSALASGILPMSITVKSKPGSGSSNSIKAFIAIDDEDHFTTNADGRRVRNRLDLLKEVLYKFNHPKTQFWRIDATGNRRPEELVEELYRKINV
jgi:hypothetical protein